MSDPFILTFNRLICETSDCKLLSVPKNQILLWEVMNPLFDLTPNDVKIDDKNHWKSMMKGKDGKLKFEDWFKPDETVQYNSTNDESKKSFHEISVFNRKIILKSHTQLDHLQREFAIGSELNNINHRVPHFCTTLSLFSHGQLFYLASLKVEGIVLRTFLNDPTTTFDDFMNVYVQTLLALEATQFMLQGFGHHDLHTENVILVEEKGARNFELYTRTFTHSFKYSPMIIDFGHASTNRIRIMEMEKLRMFSDPSPGFDGYLFVLFCIGESHEKLKHQLKSFADEFFAKMLLKVRRSNTPIKLSNEYEKNLHSGIEKLSPALLAEQLLLKDIQKNRKIQTSFRQRETFDSTFKIPKSEYFIEKHFLKNNHYFITNLRKRLFDSSIHKITETEIRFETEFFKKLDDSTIFDRLLKIELYFIIKRINLIEIEPYRSIFNHFKPDSYSSVIRDINSLHQSRDFGTIQSHKNNHRR
jgi:hypothetical protein